jgi:hypothetical protein
MHPGDVEKHVVRASESGRGLVERTLSGARRGGPGGYPAIRTTTCSLA